MNCCSAIKENTGACNCVENCFAMQLIYNEMKQTIQQQQLHKSPQAGFFQQKISLV